MELTKETRDEFRKMVVQIKDTHSIVRDNALALLDTCDALESKLTEAQAETAAVLEKAAHVRMYTYDMESEQVGSGGSAGLPKWAQDKILGLIPLPAAAALAKRERREFAAGIKVATLSITNENIVNPALVDFRAALAEVKRKERLEEAEWWAAYCFFTAPDPKHKMGDVKGTVAQTDCDCEWHKRLAQLRADEGAKL